MNRWLIGGAAVVAFMVAAVAAYPVIRAKPPSVSVEQEPAVAAHYDPEGAFMPPDTALAHISSAAITAQKDGVLVIGDSLVAASGIERLCGLPTVKGGHPGARVRDWATSGPELIAATTPRLVIFALGVNDLQAMFETDLDTWARDYERLIRAATSRKVAIQPIMPLEASKLRPDFMSPERIPEFNERLARIARETGALLLPTVESFDGRTVDGVHYNEAGHAVWTENLAGACDLVTDDKDLGADLQS